MSTVKELHTKGEATFVKGAGDKVRWWWNQSGDSEAVKMKKAWKERKSCASAPAWRSLEPSVSPQPTSCGCRRCRSCCWRLFSELLTASGPCVILSVLSYRVTC